LLFAPASALCIFMTLIYFCKLFSKLLHG